MCYCSELVVTLYTFVFTHITSVVKPVHIFMARSRVSKRPSSFSIAMCIFLVFRYIFSVFATSGVLAIRRSSLM